MFKFSKEAEVPKNETYEFVPYNWGPCSFEIYNDLASLRDSGLVQAVPTAGGWSAYRLTPAGQTRATQLRGKANRKSFQQLVSIRQWVVERPFEELLRDVYDEYPDYATQSMFVKK